MNNPHVCFSGSNACSGCNPCEPCKLHVMQCVLPIAMIKGGFNKDAAQSEAFFEGYHAGWQRLHDAMMQDPQLRQQYVARELIPAPAEAAPFGPGAGAVQQQSYPMSPDPAQQSHAPTINGAEPSQPDHSSRSMGGLQISEEDLQRPLDKDALRTLLDEATQRSTGVVVEQPSNPRTRSMTSPTRSLDAEQIASAVAPVVIGDVMHVPK